jgi:hypothetical protein
VSVRAPLAILAALLVAAVALVAAELVVHATQSTVTVANPCQPRAPFPGSGVDATVQRVVLDGLDGAACRLRTTREELVLSLRGSSRWNKRTIEVAVRAGLLRAVDEAGTRGDIPALFLPVVRGLVERLPLDKLIEGGISVKDLLGG